MNRKHFLKNVLGTAAAVTAGTTAMAMPDPPVVRSLAQPPYLQPGDIIGITCPASPLEMKDVLNCSSALKKWGYEVCVGNTVGQVWERFGGSDAERAADVQLMLDDPSIKAILFARGGYGAMRMMDRVDWTSLRKNPKWLVGYSDITAIHCHVNAQFGLPTIHGDMVNGFKAIEDISTFSLKQVISGKRFEYRSPAFGLNRKGQATAMLVGGNLSLVAAMLGSKSSLDTDGKILFLEEVSEYKYTLDRMMMSLKRSGKLDKLAGLIIGGITATKSDAETPFAMSVEEIIYEKVADKNFPVCFNFPAGHIRNNMALKLGIYYTFRVTETGGSLTEVSSTLPLIPLPDIDSLLTPPEFLP